MSTRNVPASTYRLQIRPGLTLADAAALVGQLRLLGVDALYLSPLLASTTGSDHGYDTVDPTRIDAERGGEDGWQALVDAARSAGIKLVVDIVPNHLGVEVPAENPSWWGVLAEGADSPYAHWYDIDWSRGSILLPVLGSDDDLAQLELHTAGELPQLGYYEHRFPIAAGTWAPGDSPQQVHDRQHYRLVDWRRANTELTYRRFFAVSTLAGLRVEDESVFDATHARVARWVHEDAVAGIRVDHPDGLVDPAQYLDRLRSLAGADAWLLVEKILEPGEELPPDWPLAGTTGYDAMAEVNGLFIDHTAADDFTRLYRQHTGDLDSLADHIRAGKLQAVRTLLVAETRRMADLIPDLPASEVVAALEELAASFTVYRSYLPVGTEHLEAAVATVTALRPDLALTLASLRPRLADPDDELARRFQQLSGAVMAKGVEDTAYYRYGRFVALNEVGGDPDRFGVTPADFHRAQKHRQATAPDTMTALSTHDTKRGEDVRARLAILSELPGAWDAFVDTFTARTTVPAAPFRYFLAQTVAGVGPIDRERLHAYAEKAMREAGADTTWDDPNTAFEDAVHAAVDAVYDDPTLTSALAHLSSLLEQPGWSNSLAQKLVQLTMPGVPDVYQGTEIWENSLVDPDNRRPPNFDAIGDQLTALNGPPQVDATGAAKLWVTATALRTRRDHPELFTTYTPVVATGPAADHLVAFDRGGAITVATRLPYTLAEAGGWGDTTLELTGKWTDVLAGIQHRGPVRVVDLLHRLPVALLTAAPGIDG